MIEKLALNFSHKVTQRSTKGKEEGEKIRS
jgi:hypothetical protein